MTLVKQKKQAFQGQYTSTQKKIKWLLNTGFDLRSQQFGNKDTSKPVRALNLKKDPLLQIPVMGGLPRFPRDQGMLLCNLALIVYLSACQLSLSYQKSNTERDEGWCKHKASLFCFNST